MNDNHIIQLAPCVRPLYARYMTQNENGEFSVSEKRIDFLALCLDGTVHPLTFDSLGFILADRQRSYMGLYCKPRRCQEAEPEQIAN